MLAEQIKGKVEFVLSTPDKTIFRFKIPVNLTNVTEDSLIIESSINSNF